MADELLARAAELQRAGEAFALATVVRCEAPTSAKPGAKALILEDGTVQGWVGGACAEPVVLREALQALRDGRPRLIGLYGEGGRAPGRTEGMLEYGMTCHSGGTLEIYVEPYLPKPMLVLVGHGPVIDTLATLGRAADFLVVSLAPDSLPVDLQEPRLTGRASVVVATHAESDEDALDR
ncbi:MAG: XdhC family protein, partial [Candidatus Rokuibacteriota bacterium]